MTPVACPSCGARIDAASIAGAVRCPQCAAVFPVSDAPAAERASPGKADVVDVEEASLPYRRGQPSTKIAPPAAARVQPPAVILCIICSLSIFVTVSALIKRPWPPKGPVTNPVAPQSQAARAGQIVGYVSSHVYLAVKDIYLLVAFVQMSSLRAYKRATFAAILATIPCLCSPCFIGGIPFAIWALVVLNDPAVKAAFR